MSRKAYLSDVADEEWAFVTPYLAPTVETSRQREHSLREIFNGMRWMLRAGTSWPILPHDLPPWDAVQQQTKYWGKAGIFDAIAQDLRGLLWLVSGEGSRRSPVASPSRSLPSSPDSDIRLDDTGAQRKHDRKVHTGIDMLGQVLLRHSTSADDQDRKQMQHLVTQLQVVIGAPIQVAFVEPGYTGSHLAQDPAALGLHFDAIKLLETKRGFILLPHQWVIEPCSEATARFRRLARYYERLPKTLGSLNFLALAVLMLGAAVN